MGKRAHIFDKGGALSITHLDIPIIVMLGNVVGFMASGVMLSITEPFMNAGEEELFSLKSLIAGLSNIGISIGVCLIGILYWFYIFCKHGAIAPRWNGFGLLLGISSLLSAIILGVDLYYYIIHG